LGTSFAAPAGPRGGREYLDDLYIVSGQRIEESESLEDPGVVRASMYVPRVRRPSDAANRLGYLALPVARGLPRRRAATRAIDRDNRRLGVGDELNDRLAAQMILKRNDPAFVDESGIKSLPLSAYVNPEPLSHEESMPDQEAASR
jgi:hypothetical protein